MNLNRIGVTKPTRFYCDPRPVFLALTLLGLATSAVFASLQQSPPQIRSHRQNETVERIPGPKYHPSRVLVRFKAGASPEVIRAIHQAANATVSRELPIVSGLQVVEIGSEGSLSQTLRYYRSNPNVLYAEPDYIVHALTTPNDPQFPSQWSLQNTGQSGGTPGADIHAVQAWTLSTGSSNIVVGVIDTGIDYNHQDLAPNVWNAPSGYSVTTQFGAVVQCPAGSHGFNMVASTCDPLDDNGHGSHVSGTIGAAGNNSIGVTGINWHVQLLPCKFLDANGAGDTGNAIACLSLMKELKDSGVNLIVTNNSWGGGDSSQALHDAIAATMADGMLFVAAAGNDFSDNDSVPTYPANLYLPNLISVAATDRNDSIVTFSNTGRRTVHIAAPGRDILSTTPNNTYSYDSGTSMAAPHVTGVVALLKAQNPSLDWRGIKNLILSGGDTVAGAQQTISQKRLNAYGAMTCSNAGVASRLLPVADTISGSVGKPISIAFLNIRCAQPAGNVVVSISPGNQSVTLTDDGTGSDLAANDGIYSAQWTPSTPGSYKISFPDGTTTSVQVLSQYGFVQTNFNYRSIAGTNLNLGDDSVATVTSPFTIPFGGGSFTTLYVSSNGTISFTDQFDGYQNFSLGPGDFPDGIAVPTTLVAPLWEDLFPVKGTSQNVFWAVTGNAPDRELVVEWRNVLAFPCRSDSSAGVTFQVVFKEGSSDVLFNYHDVVFGGACSYLDFGQFGTAGLLPSPTEGIMWSDGSGPGLNDSVAVLWQSPPPTGAQNPVPTLNSFSPSSIPLFSPDVTLTVNGSGFVSTSIVQWANTNLEPLPPPIDLPTTYVSSTKLTATLPSAFSAPFNRYSVGTVQSILVTNPAPGGGSSKALPISIVNPGIPSISSISPSSASAGDFSFNLDVKGNNLWAATILWNGQQLSTTQISNTEAVAAVPSAMLANAATVQIMAFASPPNGGTSNAVPFTIGPPSAAAAGPPQSPALQGTGHQSVDSNGSQKSGSQARQPIRFLGWNYGQKQDPAYLKYFSRAYGNQIIHPQGPLTTGGPPKSASRAVVDSQISLSQPSGLPGFAFHPTMPAGFLPTSVTTGDFNHDGKTDWVVSNGGSNDLWVYFGNGDGTAQLPRIIRLTGAGPIQVIAADLRKIGILDLVVAEADSQSVGVLLGNGNGTFQPEVTYFVPGPPLSIAAADVDGDGKVDLVAGIVGDASTGPIATLPGDGTGKFGAPRVTPSFSFFIGSYATTTIVLKDLNNDGLPDAVVVDSGGVVTGAHSYLNVGDGTFKHADFFFEGGDFTTVTSVAVADLDGDGCADAATVEALGLVRIFKGTCDGGFRGLPNVVTVGAGEAPVSVALADMNGDGKLDVITGGGFFGVEGGFGEEASNLVTVLFGDGTGNFAPPKVYRAEPSLFGLAVADLNGDGRPDVVVASQATDTAVVLLNDGKGNLDGPTGGYVGYITAGQSGATNAPYSGFLVQDLNGDGKPDLAFVEAEQAFSEPWEFAVMLNDGTGHFGAPTRTPMEDFGAPPAGYVLGDFRNTGRPDLVVSSTGYQGTQNPDLGFLPNNGDGSFGKARVTMLDVNAFGYLGLLASGDFNKDGKLDLVAIAATEASTPGTPGTYVLLTLLGNGDGTFRVGSSVPIEPGSFIPPVMMFVGDYNRDGNLDVLVWVYDNVIGVQNHNVYEFVGKGDGTFAAPKLILPNFGFFGMADLNHDGFPDIVEFNQLPTATNTGLDTPSYSVYIGQPDGTFKKGQTYDVYGGSVYPGYGFSNVGPDQLLTPMLADFNGDGNIDVGVVMISPYPDARSFLQVLAGNGDGTFTPTYEVTPFDKFGFPTNAADLNGDGRAELLEIDGWPSSFHVIPATPGPTVQLAFPTQPIVGTKGVVTVNLSLVPSTSETVQLSSSDVNIQVPASVTIPAGSLTATVPFSIAAGFDSSRVFSISATLSGKTFSVYSYQALQGLAGVHLFTNAVRESTPPGGTTPDYAIGVISVGGYSTSVQLSCQGLPAGATCSFGTNPLPVAAGQSNGSSLTIQAGPSTPKGSYTVIVTATDGNVSDQLKLTLNVADFSLSVSPASATLFSGATANFSLQVSAISGWTDLVTITCTVSGPTAAGCGIGGTYFPGSSPFSISTNGFATGDYTLTVSGSADGVSHQAAPVVIHVEGATSSIAPSSATIPVGGSATFNLTLNSQNGYSDQFTFACPNAPAGISCSFNPPSGSLPANGTLATVLTVTATSRPAAMPSSAEVGQSFRPISAAPIFILTLLCGLGAFTFGCRHARRRKRTIALTPFAAAAALLLIIAVVSCGGGGGTSSNPQPPPPPPPPPNPPVNVSLAVQASSSSLTINFGTISLQVK